MITAQFAFDQNRDVFVIPGSIFSPMSEGNHHLLLKDKAMIATNPNELLLQAKREPKSRLTYMNVMLKNMLYCIILIANQNTLMRLLLML